MKYARFTMPVLCAAILSTTPRASAGGSLADVCRRLQEGDLAAGDYAGRWEAEAIASGGEMDVRITLSFGGDLRLTVDDAGAVSVASGTVSVTMSGNAEGLPSILRAGLSLEGSGPMEPGASGRDRFDATATVTASARVFAHGPTARGGVDAGGSETGRLQFQVSSRSCDGAEGSLVSELVTRTTEGLAAGGLAVTINVPPRWSARAADPDRESEAERYRERAERIAAPTHKAGEDAFGALFAEIDALPAGRKACIDRVVREVYLTRVERWLVEDLERLGTFEVTGDRESLGALAELLGEVIGHDLALECSRGGVGSRAARLRPAFDAIVRGIRAALREYDLRSARELHSMLAAFAGNSAVEAADGVPGDDVMRECFDAWAEAIGEAAERALEMLEEVTAPDVEVDPAVVRTYEEWARMTERERRNVTEDAGGDRVDAYCATTEKC
jgi:hypothetical protein